MSELSYPRKWYRVGGYSGSIEEREFLRETDKTLFYKDWRGRRDRVAKQTAYERWYPTREEAEAARNACDARQYPALTEALFGADAAISKALNTGEGE